MQALGNPTCARHLTDPQELMGSLVVRKKAPLTLRFNYGTYLVILDFGTYHLMQDLVE